METKKTIIAPDYEVKKTTINPSYTPYVTTIPISVGVVIDLTIFDYTFDFDID